MIQELFETRIVINNNLVKFQKNNKEIEKNQK
jgi:hypothetical protein